MFFCNHLLNIHKSRQFTAVKTALGLRYVFPPTQVDLFHKILPLEAISKPFCYHSFSLLQSQISNLQSQISNLQSQITDFPFEIFHLKFHFFTLKSLKYTISNIQSQIFNRTTSKHHDYHSGIPH